VTGPFVPVGANSSTVSVLPSPSGQSIRWSQRKAEPCSVSSSAYPSWWRAPSPAAAPPTRPDPTRCRGVAGQTTAEYALVLLGAATIAMLVVTWASSSGAIGKLFDAVVSHVIGAVT
jgi:hypothetical protein